MALQCCGNECRSDRQLHAGSGSIMETLAPGFQTVHEPSIGVQQLEELSFPCRFWQERGIGQAEWTRLGNGTRPHCVEQVSAIDGGSDLESCND